MEKEIKKKNKLYPFHMPGHKRNKNYINEDLLKLDMTEIEGLDNLQNPKGIIKRAQEECAKIYGAKQSYILVNGASSGVMSAIFSVCGENDGIIMMRASHKSAYNAVELTGAQAYYLYSQNIFGINSGIEAQELEDILREKAKVKAVFITSPNYEGFSLDLEKISQLVHKYKKILIVDEAHGSHFVFHKRFPKTAIESGADIVINSLHKTLPCLTQSAVLHVNSEYVDTDRLKKYLTMFQTTSPSYILMSVMESSLKKISAPNFYNNYADKLLSLREKLSQNKIISLMNKEDVCAQNSGIVDLDISKLTFLVKAKQKPYEIEKILRKKFKLQIEMCGLNHFIALSTIADTDYGFELLVKSIEYLERNLEYEKKIYEKEQMPKPQVIYSIKEAASQKKKYDILYNCTNKIAAEYLVAYPPGIPIIVPGEEINDKAIESINRYILHGIEVIGIDSGYISVIKR